MAAFLEDPRLRQRWNQISHNAEAATENAAANIWTFQHTYITPCLGSVGDAFDSCTAVCLGDREERARRRRERERGAHRTLAEYSFDFYDDWYDDFNDDALEEGSSLGGNAGSGAAGAGTITSLFSRGFFGSWRGSRAEDWDRLLAGSGSVRSNGGRHYDGDDEGGGGSDADGHEDGPITGSGSGEVVDQPRRKRGMSYNTHHNTLPAVRGPRRKQPEGEDPTIIPSTAPLGFLGRLPFKIGGTLRYKPSAANLREHPNAGGSGRFSGADALHTHDENEPLLGGGGDDYNYPGESTKGDQYGTATMTMAPVSSSTPRPWTAAAGTSEPIDAAEFDASGNPTARQRSSTVGSGDTSDSYRSRGDLFPSDEEDDEDAVPLDDEFAVALGRVDDRSSGRTRFSSSSSLAGAAAGILNGRKGKRRADTGASYASLGSMASHGSGGTGPVAIRKGVLSRSVSRTTIDSIPISSPRSGASSIKKRLSTLSLPGESAPAHVTPDAEYEGPVEDIEENVDEDDEDDEDNKHNASLLSIDQLREEDERAAREEDAVVERRREAALRLARERGLGVEPSPDEAVSAVENMDAAPADTKEAALNEPATTSAAVEEDSAVAAVPVPVPATPIRAESPPPVESPSPAAPPSPPTPTAEVISPVSSPAKTETPEEAEFVPARLPRFS
ncbi:hypothetical protein F503_08794 [Ophiostoma piceae UAMH 11346]|uniref:Uncharacterized protein n=1 Tax=Ophiostoma piceae (strain UAMH 11346) TaxID=1262450 RepID=S3BR56_OPHP1|nr:hypothetical protein F503_08794 [Ophiostoma piceae UAMH 11346]